MPRGKNGSYKVRHPVVPQSIYIPVNEHAEVWRVVEFLDVSFSSFARRAIVKAAMEIKAKHPELQTQA